MPSPPQESINLTTRGTAAVGLKDIDFELKRTEDVWDFEEDLFEREFESAVTFESGSRGGARNCRIWSITQGLVKQLIAKSTPGARKFLLGKIENSLHTNKMGYSDFYLNRVEEKIRKGKNILNFNSGDTGDFIEGYEIFNNEVTESESATTVFIDEEIESGQASVASETLDSERYMETFIEFKRAGRFFYSFDGKTLPELKKEYPVQHQIGRGGFSYYMLLETDSDLYATAISSDLGVVVSYLPEDLEIQKAHLVRAPDFSTYKAKCLELVEDLSDGAHISLNPPQMNFYQKNLSELVKKTHEEPDQYIITVDNAMRGHEEYEYIYPTYLSY